MKAEKGKQPLLYIASSVIGWAVDVVLFYGLNLLLRVPLGVYAEPVCNVLARIASSLLNFNLNYRLVFNSTQTFGQAMLRYYFLAVPQLAVSTVLVTLFTDLLKVESAGGATAVKIVIDGCLFVVSFFIQKFWVFRKKDTERNNKRKK